MLVGLACIGSQQINITRNRLPLDQFERGTMHFGLMGLTRPA